MIDLDKVLRKLKLSVKHLISGDQKLTELGSVYTSTFSIKNEYFSLRFSLPFTTKRWKHLPQTKTFESGDLSGDFENGASKNTHVNDENEYLNEYEGQCQPIVTWLIGHCVMRNWNESSPDRSAWPHRPFNEFFPLAGGCSLGSHIA